MDLKKAQQHKRAMTQARKKRIKNKRDIFSQNENQRARTSYKNKPNSRYSVHKSKNNWLSSKNLLDMAKMAKIAPIAYIQPDDMNQKTLDKSNDKNEGTKSNYSGMIDHLKYLEICMDSIFVKYTLLINHR